MPPPLSTKWMDPQQLDLNQPLIELDDEKMTHQNDPIPSRPVGSTGYSGDAEDPDSFHNKHHNKHHNTHRIPVSAKFRRRKYNSSSLLPLCGQCKSCGLRVVKREQVINSNGSIQGTFHYLC